MRIAERKNENAPVTLSVDELIIVAQAQFVNIFSALPFSLVPEGRHNAGGNVGFVLENAQNKRLVLVQCAVY